MEQSRVFDGNGDHGTEGSNGFWKLDSNDKFPASSEDKFRSDAGSSGKSFMKFLIEKSKSFGAKNVGWCLCKGLKNWFAQFSCEEVSSGTGVELRTMTGTACGTINNGVLGNS